MVEEIWGSEHYMQKMEVIEQELQKKMQKIGLDLFTTMSYETRPYNKPCLFLREHKKFLFIPYDSTEQVLIEYYCNDDKRMVKIYVRSSSFLMIARSLAAEMETFVKKIDKTYSVVLSKEYYS